MAIVPPGTFVHRHSSSTFDYMNFIRIGIQRHSIQHCLALWMHFTKDCPEQQLSLLNDPFLRFIDKKIELNYLTLTGHHSVLPFQNNNRPHQESSPHAGCPGRNWIDIKRNARIGLILNKQHKTRSRSIPSCHRPIRIVYVGAECS